MTDGENDDMTDEQVTQLLRFKESNVLLHEQVKALDQRLVAAKEVSAGCEKSTRDFAQTNCNSLACTSY